MAPTGPQGMPLPVRLSMWHKFVKSTQGLGCAEFKVPSPAALINRILLFAQQTAVVFQTVTLPQLSKIRLIKSS